MLSGGAGDGRGCGCRFDKLDFRVWALGLGLVLEQNPRNLVRGESAIQQPEGLEGLGNMAAYLISMVFGWRQEFSCGFGAAWAGSGRRPSLANMLPPRVPGGVG